MAVRSVYIPGSHHNNMVACPKMVLEHLNWIHLIYPLQESSVIEMSWFKETGYVNNSVLHHSETELETSVILALLRNTKYSGTFWKFSNFNV